MNWMVSSLDCFVDDLAYVVIDIDDGDDIQHCDDDSDNNRHDDNVDVHYCGLLVEGMKKRRKMKKKNKWTTLTGHV